MKTREVPQKRERNTPHRISQSVPSFAQAGSYEISSVVLVAACAALTSEQTSRSRSEVASRSGPHTAHPATTSIGISYRIMMQWQAGRPAWRRSPAGAGSICNARDFEIINTRDHQAASARARDRAAAAASARGHADKLCSVYRRYRMKKVLNLVCSMRIRHSHGNPCTGKLNLQL
eukprot:SAG31_NODE_1916_length_6929_cov_4.013324_4_plen_176_part_00